MKQTIHLINKELLKKLIPIKNSNFEGFAVKSDLSVFEQYKCIYGNNKT
jgi:hypothetical protein